MTLQQLNRELCAALGIKDITNVSQVVLTITASETPRIVVHRIVRTADGLQTAVEQLRLKPEPVVREDLVAVGEAAQRLAEAP